MNNRYLIAGDEHINSCHEFSKPTKDGLSVRLQQHLLHARQISQRILDYKPSCFVSLGDIFHTHTTIGVDSLITAKRWFDTIYAACRKVGAHFYIVVGNHDYYSLTSNLHACEIFKGIEGVTVVDEFLDTPQGVFIPYMEDFRVVEALVNGVSDKESKVCFSHINFLGAGFSPTIKDTTSKNLPDWFKDFRKVYAGHIHMPQVLGKNIKFPGSLNDFSFKSPRADRGLILFDSGTGDEDFIQIISPDFLTFNDDNIQDVGLGSGDFYANINLSSKMVLEAHGYSEEWLKENTAGYYINYDYQRIKKGEALSESVQERSFQEILSEYVSSSIEDPKDHIKYAQSRLLK